MKLRLFERSLKGLGWTEHPGLRAGFFLSLGQKHRALAFAATSSCESHSSEQEGDPGCGQLFLPTDMEGHGGFTVTGRELVARRVGLQWCEELWKNKVITDSEDPETGLS